MESGLNIGINGLGYIGRLLTRLIMQNKIFNLKVINDIISIENAASLIKYNTNHGKTNLDIFIEYTSNSIVINGQKIFYFNKSSPQNIPWKQYDIDLVFECTGNFSTRMELCGHISSGAKRVLLSSPTKSEKDADITVVFGINHNKIKENHKIISNASCTTNTAASILYPISQKYDMLFANMTVIHGPTSEFCLMDNGKNDSRKIFSLKDNLIPTTTSAAKTILRILPGLKNKVNSEAFYAPFRGASIMNFSILIKDKITVNQVHELLSSFGKKANILKLVNDNIASTCLLSSGYSAIVDENLSSVVHLDHSTLINLSSWFDHEYGFSSRMIDVANYIATAKI